jgi:serine protease Do
MRNELNRVLPSLFIVALITLATAFALPQAAESATVADALPSFSQLIKQIAPAVVNISSETVLKPDASSEDQPTGGDEGFRDFVEKFFGNRPDRAMKRKALGSGFLIDPSGLILTNNHVVQKATAITVVLADQREFKAKVIGTDPKTDIALIKITSKERLPSLPLGDSDKMEVGDWVIAVGNPFGLSSTITHGIISAKGRVIGLGPYDDFLQTDAPINPGNSGGPLLNLRGEVIGVTTAMGSGQSIGFAIPSNLARTVSDQLKDKGKVTRGYIGASIQDVTPQLAQAMGLKDTKGALVGDVVEGAPADLAGVKRGDVIISFGAKPVRSANDLPILVAGTPVGKTVPMTFIREGKEKTVQVHVQELKEEKGGRTKGTENPESSGELGMSINNITPALQQQLGLKERNGVLVAEVKNGSPASEAGIEQGDVILSVNRKQISNVSEFRAAVAAAKKGQPLLMLIKRESTSLFVTIERP